MPHRVSHMLGTFADVGVGTFALLFGFYRMVTFGWTDPAVVLPGLAALLIAYGRMMKYLADAELAKAQAQVQASYVDPKAYKVLEENKCYRAPECENRLIHKPDHDNDDHGTYGQPKRRRR